jgi:hypothetical protein
VNTPEILFKLALRAMLEYQQDDFAGLKFPVLQETA